MMLRIFVIIAALLTVTLATATRPKAAESAAAELPPYDGIAAVVDSEAITFGEMHQRMLLLAASLGLDLDRRGVADQLRPELINAIISERLRLKRAQTSGISISGEELDAAIADIESRNNIKPGSFTAAIIARGGDGELAKRQILNQMMWQKYVDLNLRPRIVISEEEVAERIKALTRLSGKTEYQYGEIFIADDNNPKAAAEFIKQLAATIAATEPSDRMAMVFSRVARQYSVAASAAGGGEVGWHVGELMDEAKYKALKRTPNGGLSAVVKAKDGFYLMLLHQTRVIGKAAEDKVTLRRFNYEKVEENNGEENSVEEIVEIVKGGDGSVCEVETGELKITEFADVSVPDLSDSLKQSVAAIDARVGEVFVDRGQVYAVCEYRVGETVEPDPNEVASRIVAERLDKMVQKTVRSLVRNAYIDVRS